jgi:hypothetical protein
MLQQTPYELKDSSSNPVQIVLLEIRNRASFTSVHL